MNPNILIKYAECIYGYAIKRTYSREEADELSQEILLTTLKQLPTLKDENLFEPWLWGIAANVMRDFRRKQGKQRAMFAFDVLSDMSYTDEYVFIDEELYTSLRSRISQLSAIYRDIIVLYYFDGLSVKDIANRLCIPEGTVTWRLSEGRKKLKYRIEGCKDMTEQALRPISMDIRINGNGNYNGKDKPFPWMFIKDALSQNVLYHCYHEAKTVETLSGLCGVPAYYIEDALQNLKHREAITEPSKGKYLTDFIIYGAEHSAYNEKAGKFLEDIIDEFAELIKSFTEAVIQNGVYTAGKAPLELCYLFGIMAMEHLNNTYNPFAVIPFKTRYDGNEWCYHAHINGTYKSGTGMGAEKNLNTGGSGTFAHCSYHFAGFGYRPILGYDKINICERIINRMPLTDDEEKEKAAEMIAAGYLSSCNGDIKLMIPTLTLAQKRYFDNLADNHFKSFMPKYVKIITSFTDGYRKLFPKHLMQEVDRALHQLSIGFFANAVNVAQQRGLLNRPAPDEICDVLVQHS